MKTYCITGISGYIGSLLAEKVLAEEDTRVIGIDISSPKQLHRHFSEERFTHYQIDIRDQDAISRIFRTEAPHTSIHLAFYTAPEGDVNQAYAVNIEGTKNVLHAAADSGVRRIILLSSSAAYGSHPDNPVPITEDRPLKGNENYYYSHHKQLQEEVFRDFLQDHPDIQYVIIRPCVLLGPHINNQTGDLMRSKVLVNAAENKNVPIQFIYEDDAVEAIYQASKSSVSGVYNIASEKTLTMPEIAKLLNKPLIQLPLWFLSPLAGIAKTLKITPVGSKSLKFTINPIVVDPTKYVETFGFKPKHDSEQTVRKFAEVRN